jgi:dolichol-phosphate mannosyltransferase
MIPSHLDVSEVYSRRFSPEDQRAKNEIWKVLVGAFFQKWVRPEDTVLDLGCGYGEFLNHIHCKRKIGIDLNPDSPKHLEKGVEFHSASVCELPFIPESSVDFVFTSNLMEHLPSKMHVEQMIAEARRVLRPGGQFVMMGPNIRFLHGQYWDFWDHLVAITDRSLVEVLENSRFQIGEAHAKFLPYTTRSKIPQSPALVKLYLKVPLVWGLMGGQFLIRAVKPAAPAR